MFCKRCLKRERWCPRALCKVCLYASRGQRNYIDYLRYDRVLVFEELVVLGFWLGDGCWHGGGPLPALTVNRDEKEGLERILERLQITYTEWKRPEGCQVTDLNLHKAYGLRMIDLGFRYPMDVYQKAIPIGLMEKGNYRGLLTGLIQSDGSTKESTYFQTVSRILASQTQEMLTSQGVVWKEKTYEFEKGTVPGIRTTVLSESVGTLRELLPLWGSKGRSLRRKRRDLEILEELQAVHVTPQLVA